MSTFVAKKFSFPKLKGISEKSLLEHTKLYNGYVTNANTILEKIEDLRKDPERNAYVLGELYRRFSFEYDGMRNHEVYFASLQGGAKTLTDESMLKKKIEETWGPFEAWLASFKKLGQTRGIGWAVLWYDPKDDRLLSSWIDEQHLGQLNGCAMILALDMWEHSYAADYQPSGKKDYIEDFFANLDWSAVEENMKIAAKTR